MASLKVVDVYKSYTGGDNYVIRGANFFVEHGEFATLLGPSGCGKTTMLRMIAGLETIDRGEIYIGDRLVNNVPAALRNVAMVFQSYALYPHMTVYENIAVGLRLRKFPKKDIDERINDVTKKLEINHLLDRYPAQLSGGQRQRVALARALVKRPAIFLFDEPLSNLDAAIREKARSEIKLLFKSLNATAVYVTHDQVEAMTLSDKVILLNDGIIQQVGKPKELYDRPANVFVATFIGSPRMNILNVVVTEQGFKVDDNLTIPPTTPKLQKWIKDNLGKSFLLGIRPEDIKPAVEREPHAKLEVAIVEPLGLSNIVHLKVNDKLIIKSLIEKDQEITSPMPIYFTKNLHVFDESTQKRIDVGFNR